MSNIFPIDFEEKLTMAQDDYILFSDSEDGNKIKKAQYKNLKGEKGDTGTAATITVGSTTTGAAGSAASVTNSGTSSAAVLDFTIPKGDKGDTGATGPAIVSAAFNGNDIDFTEEDGNVVTLTDAKIDLKGDAGDAATVSVGTTSTLSPGSSATVTNSGTSSAAVFNFGIPKGEKGDTGDTGTAATISVGTTTTGDAGTSASVTNSGTSSAAVFNFTIPKGDKGDTGSTGAAATISVGSTSTLSPGSSATVTNSGTSSAAVFDFGIPQGATGATGNGIASITSSKSGKITTVTITETNSTVDTFQISDGADGQGSGDVLGPASSVDGDVAVFDGNTGKLIKDSGVTLGTAASKDTGTSSGNVPVLDSNGKLATSTLPGVALTDTFTVSTSSDLTSLSSAEQGDLAIATTENKTYVLSADPYSTAANWKEILSPTGGVTSVNSQTGAVTLDADDISDSTTTNKFVTASDKTTWSGKQDALVSGTNIKTINSNSLLGSGDLIVGGDVGISTDTGNLLTAGDKLWFGSESDFSGISTPASDTLYIQFKSDGGGGWQPGANTIAYYPLTSVSTVNDMSGNNYTLTNSNVTFGVNQGVDCAVSDGSNQLYTTISSIPSGASSRTLSVWLYIDSYVNDREYNIVGYGQNSMYKGYQLYASGGAVVSIRTYYGDVGTSRINDYYQHWINIIGVYNGTTNSLYINGNLANSGTVSLNTFASDLYIGNSPFVGYGITGYVSNVILEDKAWSGTEVSNYYNGTKANYGIS